MASNREERFLMRQRGAGTRQIKEVDFGIAFPPTVDSPLKPQQSARSTRSRRTPQPENDTLAPQRSTRRTPANTSQRLRSSSLEPGAKSNVLVPRTQTQSSSARSTRSNRTGTAADKQRAIPATNESGAKSSKRQKVEPAVSSLEEVPESDNESPEEQRGSSPAIGQDASSSSPLARPRRRTGRLSAGDADSAVDSIINQQRDARRATNKSRSSLDSQKKKQPDQQIKGRPSQLAEKPSTKARRRSARISLESVEESAHEGVSQEGSQGESPPTTIAKRGRPRKPLDSKPLNEQRVEDEEGQPSTAKARRGRPRKSLDSSKPVDDTREESSEEQLSSRTTKRGGPRKSLDLSRPVDKASSSTKVKKRRKRVSFTRVKARNRTSLDSALSTAEGSAQALNGEQSEEHDDISPVQSNTRKPRPARKPGVPTPTTTPRPVGRPSKPARPSPLQPSPGSPARPRGRRPQTARPSPSSPEAPRTRGRPRGPPVTVHRHTLAPTSTTTTTGVPTFIRPAGVNAIDVLAQVTSELIAGHAASLERNSGSGARRASSPRAGTAPAAETKRKRKAVEAFGDELRERCFVMTETLDTQTSLTTRLKHATRAKHALRNDLLALRRERTRLALRMDAVRAKHDEARRTAMEAMEVEEVVRDVGLVVQRGGGKEDEGGGEDGERMVEEGIREVVGEGMVGAGGDAGGAGGLLDRVRGFNAFLERAAGVLEGRGGG
ncbi:MAG: hypothetical protein M1833_005988 [Piccolia ochrophora]|nr:MAG: hypothetical protein M1833_005988 [Piccolia ochrophora]